MLNTTSGNSGTRTRGKRRALLSEKHVCADQQERDPNPGGVIVSLQRERCRWMQEQGCRQNRLQRSRRRSTHCQPPGDKRGGEDCHCLESEKTKWAVG